MNDREHPIRPMTSFTCRRGVSVSMRDDVKLATDLYLPANAGQEAAKPLPVLLERTPYGRDMPQRALDAQFFASRGYAVAVQDVRGRFESEGQWQPFLSDPEDGYDTIQWLAQQPWCNGKVGTLGASYAGTVQAGTATLNPPALSAMVVTTAAADSYQATMRHGGAMELRWVSFIFNMALTSKEAIADMALRQELQQIAQQVEPSLRHLPREPGRTPLRLLPHYERWLLDVLNHTERDEFWRQRCFAPLAYAEEFADVPTLHIGGWYDSYAGATCDAFTQLRAVKRSRQCLIMGPWEHAALEDRAAGELDFGANAVRLQNELRLAWLDRYLKDQPTVADDWPDAQLFVMGRGSGRRTAASRIDRGGTWIEAAAYPPAAVQHQPYYLHARNSLKPGKPQGTTAPSQFTFDPDKPVPTIGGCVSAGPTVLKPGGYDQRERADWFACQGNEPLARRADVLCFQTEPLAASMRIVGPVTVELFIASSVTDTDFTAKLVEIYPPTDDDPDGLAINLTDGIMRARYRKSFERPEPLIPGQVELVTLSLFPTACDIAPGHRLRLDISSSNFPRFDLNPHQSQSAEQSVYHDAAHASRVILPVVT